MSVAMWNCHSWPPDVSSNVKLAKLGSSANFGVLVIKASLFYYLGGHLPKYVYLPSFVYWYSRQLCSIHGGFFCQRRFVCQVWCSGIQGISALLPRGAIGQSRFVCWLWCTGIDGIYALLPGVFQVCQGVSKGLHLTWLYNADWLFFNLIIQK